MGVVKTIGVEYCGQCPYGKAHTKGEFAFCMKAEAGTGKMIPIKLWKEGIIPEWCPLDE